MNAYFADNFWLELKRIVLWFIICYLSLYTLNIVIGFIPLIDILESMTSLFWNVIVPWVGENVFRLNYEIPLSPNGSGDTTFYYVQTFVIAVVAALTALILLFAVPRRQDQRLALAWLITFIRYSMGFILIMYGSVKIIKLQFPALSLYRLLQNFGDASPMGLMWTFVGYSSGYNLFAGLGEAIGGLLLFFRRTTTLGAVIVLAVMGNVLAMNLFYDIPVKLFSAHLVLMAIFLLSTDANRLVRFFILNQPTSPRTNQLQFKPRTRRILLIIKSLLIGGVVFSYAERAITTDQERGDNAPEPPLYGIYDVRTYILNGDTLPPLITDSVRWKRLIIDRRDRAWVYQMNDSSQFYTAEVDTVQQQLIIAPSDTLNQELLLTYEQPNAQQLNLRGIFGTDTIVIETDQYDINNFLLLRRGFHWINEYPFNR